MIFYDSGHLLNEYERPDMKRKCMNTDKAQWKEPDLTTLISEVFGGIDVARGFPEGHDPSQIFSISSHFVLWEAASQTKIVLLT